MSLLASLAPALPGTTAQRFLKATAPLALPLRVLLRVARSATSDLELLQSLLQQQLFPFMPKGAHL